MLSINKNKFGLLILLITLSFKINAQNSRMSDENAIGWYSYNGTYNFNEKWGFNTEFQWRRDHIISRKQQNLFRSGINYKVNKKLTLRTGYALIETYNYGDIPLNPLGKQFTEHRVYQMAILNDNLGKLDLSHRFMLEQRWIGRYSNAALTKEDSYAFSNRLRYMFRMQLPLKGNSMGNNTPYAAIFDEVLIGFGKNVNENIFDQNRVGIVLGYKFSDVIRAEAGYLSQVVQLSREVNNRNVFQYNNGLLVSMVLNTNLFKTK